jgi:hypothetical protein
MDPSIKSSSVNTSDMRFVTMYTGLMIFNSKIMIATPIFSPMRIMKAKQKRATRTKAIINPFRIPLKLSEPNVFARTKIVILFSQTL